MKMKCLLTVLFTLLLIFLIYLSTLDKKIYYLSLGDYMATGLTNDNKYYGYGNLLENYLSKNNILETYVNNYSNNTYRTTDLINNIKNNKKIVINNKTKTIKNTLVKADIITISIGSNDLKSKLNYDYNNYDYIDEMFKDLEELFKLLRKYCKEEIIYIGLYSPNNDKDDLYKYINKTSKELCNKYKINYIDTYNLSKKHPEYFKDKPTKEGYNAIFRQIKRQIDKKIAKNP